MCIRNYDNTTYVHSNAFVKEVALVCADLIGMEFAIVDEIRATIKPRTGIANTLLNCSHTHS